VDNIQSTVPAHIPTELVRDFDIFQDILGFQDPHDRVLAAQKTSPAIFYTTRNGGHWVITRRADVHAVLLNTNLFSSAGVNIPPFPEGTADSMPARIPITLDPPDHTKYRKLVNGIFSPKAVAQMEVASRELTNRLIDGVMTKKEFDFVADISTPLPVMIFMTMMDMPLDRYDELSEWVNEFFVSTDIATQVGIMKKIELYMESVVSARIAKPGEDVVSELLASEIDGAPVSREVVLSICNLLFLAGLDTVTAALSYLAYGLAMQPKWMTTLRADPSLVTEAIEESLRIYAIPNTMRRVTADAQFNGIQLKRNEVAFLCLSVAGLDDQFVKDPQVFDPMRPRKPHLAFSGGPHRCVGSHLARMEMRVFLEEWLKRMPDFKLKPDKPLVYRGGITFALQGLWLLNSPVATH